MTPEQQLAQMAVELPPPGKPLGLYCPILTVDTLAYLSGHGPLRLDGTLITGRVGCERSQEEGFAAARQVGLAVLATLREHLGSLDRVERLVKTVGMVQCTPDFKEIPAVVNGFSELMREVFGQERGVAVRSAVGMASLPADMAVEIECVFQIS